MSSISHLIGAVDRGAPPSHNIAALHGLHALILEELRPAAKPAELRRVARHLRTAIPKMPHDVTAVSAWEPWYGGYFQSLLELVIAALRRPLPEGIDTLLRRTYVVPVLVSLHRGDRRLSDLATECEMDLSHIDREIARMAEKGLVMTAKRGRERWVTVTGLGGLALELWRRQRPRPVSPVCEPRDRKRQLARDSVSATRDVELMNTV